MARMIKHAMGFIGRVVNPVRAWRVDIGDKVKQGQLLAEIETPELDQELSQGQAQLLQTVLGP